MKPYQHSLTYETINVSPTIPPEVIPPYQGAQTLYILYNEFYKKHILTKAYSEIELLVLNTTPSWKYEAVMGYIYLTQEPNTVPLYRFFSSSSGGHYFSTNPSPPSGYVQEEIMGYVYTSQVGNTKPLYLYHNPGIDSYVVAHTWGELENGKNGYNYLGVLCYILS